MAKLTKMTKNNKLNLPNIQKSLIVINNNVIKQQKMLFIKLKISKVCIIIIDFF